MKSTLCFSFFLVLVFTGFSYADIIGIPGDQATIQAGINAASDGDTVLVASGIYVENIDFNGKAIIVKSERGAENTIIDGNQNGSVVTFSSSEGADSILEGFILRNGNGTVYNRFGQTRGGGVFCDNSSSPIIRKNIITGNTSLEGGGIYCGNNCSMTISDNIISDNDVLHQPIAGTAGDGGGIFIAVASPVVIHNAIINNLARIGGGIRCNVESGIAGVDFVSARIINNIISNNSAAPFPGTQLAWSAGGGIDCSANPVTITEILPIIINNTITNNSAYDGGGIRSANCTSTLINNILWFNKAPNGSEICLSPGGDIIVTYSDIQGGWEGEGNIDADPLFVDPDNGDYHLQASSPCIDAGDPNSLKDPDGTRANMGAFYYNQSFNSVAITTLEKVSGDNQSGIAKTTLPNPLVVKVLDQNRNPIKGVVVNFFPTKGANVNPTQAITNDNGEAQTILTLATRKGYYNITAYADGILPTTFTATAITGIIHVPSDYPTIQSGIYAASDGDIVLVADGTYTGLGNVNLDFRGKAITLKSVNGASATIIDGQNIPGTRGVIFQSGETKASVLDGFTITNANATAVEVRGGGIYCKESSPTISNCIITKNSANIGGGISSSSSYHQGFLESGDIVVYFEGELVSNNSIIGHRPTIINCIIAGNKSSYRGGGIYCQGSSPIIIDCTITKNVSGKQGGGIYSDFSSPSITNCIITNNEAKEGGGIYFNPKYIYGIANSEIINCVIAENKADFGGGIYNISPFSPRTINCVIARNKATFGGGIYNTSSFSPSSIINCTIAYNIATGTRGGGVYKYIEGTNILLWGNTSGFFPNEDSRLPDPLFVNADNGDYHLSAGSPYINAGTTDGAPSTDIEGNPRPFGNGVDVGAYEWVGSASPPLWDVNEDGVVNIRDFVIVGRNFGQKPPRNPRADVNKDGQVDITDLVLVSSHFGESTVMVTK